MNILMLKPYGLSKLQLLCELLMDIRPKKGYCTLYRDIVHYEKYIEKNFTSVYVNMLTLLSIFLDVHHFSLELSALSWCLLQENEDNPEEGTS